jgi:hypothetical protein
MADMYLIAHQVKGHRPHAGQECSFVGQGCSPWII